jgi:pimeloyl-[acyl-carrier protein] methyl ester esterase
LLLEALSKFAGSPPARLILVGVAPVFCQRPDYPWGQPTAVVRGLRRGLKKDPRQVLHEFAAQCLAPGEAAFGSQAKALFATAAGSGSLAAGLDYLLKQDLRPLLRGLTPGAVIIQGLEDRIVPPAQGRFLRDQLSGARLHNLPGAGHLPFLTQAPAFNGIIAECLSTVSQPCL